VADGVERPQENRGFGAGALFDRELARRARVD
jgi:hypothetical protein